MIRQRTSTAMVGAVMLWALAACSVEGSKDAACSAAAGIDNFFGVGPSEGRAEDCGDRSGQSARRTGGGPTAAAGGTRAAENRETRRPDLLPAERTVVIDLQRRLGDLGYDPGPADGIMGAKSRGAIREFRWDHGLPVDGRLTSSLRERIRAESPG